MARPKKIIYDLKRLYDKKNNKLKDEVIAKAIIEIAALPEESE